MYVLQQLNQPHLHILIFLETFGGQPFLKRLTTPKLAGTVSMYNL
jgi:hypothetical protein